MLGKSESSLKPTYFQINRRQANMLFLNNPYSFYL